VHLARLVELEHAIAHRDARAGFRYELAYDGGGEDGRPYVPGLIDVEALGGIATTPIRSASNELQSGVGRGPVGPRSGGGRDGELARNPPEPALSADLAAAARKTHRLRGNGKNASYP
jgi:hypothetical protein